MALGVRILHAHMDELFMGPGPRQPYNLKGYRGELSYSEFQAVPQRISVDAG